MKSWPVQDAKAHFSEFLNACEREGPQVVTRRGAEAAVLVPIDEWRRLAAASRPTLFAPDAVGFSRQPGAGACPQHCRAVAGELARFGV